MAKLLSLVLFVAATNALPWYKSTQGRIVGGFNAEPGQFPYIVSLKDWKIGHMCGGSIINENWVLTAAHCVDYYTSVKQLTILAGSNQLTSGTVHDVSRIVVNKGWNPINVESDIALVKVTQPFKFTDKVQPIKYATTNTPADETAVLCGWGITSFPSDIPSDVLKYINYKTTEFSTCLMAHFPDPVASTCVCALPTTSGGACSGDSGSPLAKDGVLIGVASWVRPCGVGYPDVFTKVFGFADWISTTVAL